MLGKGVLIQGSPVGSPVKENNGDFAYSGLAVFDSPTNGKFPQVSPKAQYGFRSKTFEPAGAARHSNDKNKKVLYKKGDKQSTSLPTLLNGGSKSHPIKSNRVAWQTVEEVPPPVKELTAQQIEAKDKVVGYLTSQECALMYGRVTDANLPEPEVVELMEQGSWDAELIVKHLQTLEEMDMRFEHFKSLAKTVQLYIRTRYDLLLLLVNPASNLWTSSDIPYSLNFSTVDDFIKESGAGLGVLPILTKIQHSGNKFNSVHELIHAIQLISSMVTSGGLSIGNVPNHELRDEVVEDIRVAEGGPDTRSYLVHHQPPPINNHYDSEISEDPGLDSTYHSHSFSEDIEEESHLSEGRGGHARRRRKNEGPESAARRIAHAKLFDESHNPGKFTRINKRAHTLPLNFFSRNRK